MNTVTTYNIKGITCDGCVKTITEIIEEFPSAKLINNPSNPLSLKIELNEKNQASKLNHSLQAEGYSLEPFEIESIPTPPESTYRPLALILVFLLLAVGLAQWQNQAFNPMLAMRHFMGGFFLIFSFFKLLDLPGFARSYQQYDLLAGTWKPYGFIYPFLELLLGIYYLSPLNFSLVVWFTLALMSFSTLGVAKSLIDKRKIKCACLGTVFNLPMSTVTLIEDLAMVVMAVYMLLA